MHNRTSAMANVNENVDTKFNVGELPVPMYRIYPIILHRRQRSGKYLRSVDKPIKTEQSKFEEPAESNRHGQIPTKRPASGGITGAIEPLSRDSTD